MSPRADPPRPRDQNIRAGAAHTRPANAITAPPGANTALCSAVIEPRAKYTRPSVTATRPRATKPRQNRVRSSQYAAERQRAANTANTIVTASGNGKGEGETCFMSNPEKSDSLASLRVRGEVVNGNATLRWTHIPHIKMYGVEWLDPHGEWLLYGTLEADEIAPDQNGELQFIDTMPGAAGPIGTYRVTGYEDPSYEGKHLTSDPVVFEASEPAKSEKDELRRRLDLRTTREDVKAIILAMKPGERGWITRLPDTAPTCLGEPIELEVCIDPLDDAVLNLLVAILEGLPTIVGRAEQAFYDHFGKEALARGWKVTRPHIWMYPAARPELPIEEWTLVIDVKNSDYGWHVEFVGTEFKEIWGGS